MLNLSNPSAKSVSWDEPLEMLYACHGKVKKFCAQLQKLPPYLREHGCDSDVRAAVRQICTYFDVAAPLHHDDEEQDFFPALLHYAPQAQAAVDELESQHVTLGGCWRRLRAQLLELDGGSRSQLDSALLNDFVQGYAGHIAIEEPLFEMGREHIPQPELARIGAVMAARRQTS